MSVRIRSVCLVMLLLAITSPPVLADNASEIRAICASNWPDDAKQQRLCVQRQHAAAGELVSSIEAAKPGSREYDTAKECIERAKVEQPSRIDWTQALHCFNSRIAPTPAEPTDTR
ncbi:MAG: hypothetical protein GY733_07445 [bacterium]|nr:hypothetical protein [bacterium]